LCGCDLWRNHAGAGCEQAGAGGFSQFKLALNKQSIKEPVLQKTGFLLCIIQKGKLLWYEFFW
jgi:hypothetical protein